MKDVNTNKNNSLIYVSYTLFIKIKQELIS